MEQPSTRHTVSWLSWNLQISTSQTLNLTSPPLLSHTVYTSLFYSHFLFSLSLMHNMAIIFNQLKVAITWKKKKKKREFKSFLTILGKLPIPVNLGIQVSIYFQLGYWYWECNMLTVLHTIINLSMLSIINTHIIQQLSIRSYCKVNDVLLDGIHFQHTDWHNECRKFKPLWEVDPSWVCTTGSSVQKGPGKQD